MLRQGLLQARIQAQAPILSGFRGASPGGDGCGDGASSESRESDLDGIDGF